MWGHSDFSLFLTILASEKLFIDLGGGSDALTEIDQMPEDFRRQNKAGINDGIQWSVPKFPMVCKGQQNRFQKSRMQDCANPLASQSQFGPGIIND